MRILDKVTRLAKELDLEFLVIGGHAVAYHGYSCRTFDLDLLIPRDKATAWKEALVSAGYKLEFESENSLQCAPPGDAAGGWPIDLMLVNNDSFSQMLGGAVRASIQGCPVQVVSLEHLLALKLHVLKQSLLHRFEKDFEDVVVLAEVNKMDVLNDRFRDLCHRYGNSAVYEQIVRVSKSRH